MGVILLKVIAQIWSYFNVLLLQNGPIISRDTGRCLEVEMSKDANFGLRLVVQRCSGQKWMIRNWIKHPRHWSQRTTSETVWALFEVDFGSLTGQFRAKQGLVLLVCGISHYRLHCTLSFPQATVLPTLSVKEEYDQFMCSTELCVHRDLMASCAVWNGPHFWHSATCTEQSNKTQVTRVSPLKVVQDPSNFFCFYCKTRDEKECACVCLAFFLSASEQIKRNNCCQFPHQSDYFGLWFGKLLWTYWAALASHVKCFKGAAHHLIGRHFTCTHKNHYSSLFLWTVLLTMDRSNHVPFFSFFCFIWPGNVSPKSMYKIIWKLLIYKTMYKTV